jgi:hypothetical protein
VKIILSILIFAILCTTIFTTQSCLKAKYDKPTCDSACIGINAIFWNSVSNEPFANEKMTVKVGRNTGLGMSFSTLWDVKTNSNGEANFDVALMDLITSQNKLHSLNFFLCNTKFREKKCT